MISPEEVWICLELTALLLLGKEHLVDLLTNLVVGDLDIILGVTAVGHKGHEAVLGDIELIFVNPTIQPSSHQGNSRAGTPCE